MLGFQQLVEQVTRGFCLQKIFASDLPNRTEWEAKEQDWSLIEPALSQPFYFLGAGSECFAFISQDLQTVVKFFKLDIARPVYFRKGLLKENYSANAGTLSNHPLLRKNPPLFILRLLGIREYRIGRTFESVKYAHEHLKEETGLLYLHLNLTTQLQKKLTLYDPSGIRQEIDLDQTRFFVQKAAIPLEKHFVEIASFEEGKESINSLIALLLTRCQKGFSDRDILCRNFGFVGTSAIEIDCGSFLLNPQMKTPLLSKQELYFATRELKRWLKKHNPQLASYLEDQVAKSVCAVPSSSSPLSCCLQSVSSDCIFTIMEDLGLEKSSQISPLTPNGKFQILTSPFPS